MTYSIYPMPQYEEWLQTQTEKSKLQIELGMTTSWG